MRRIVVAGVVLPFLAMSGCGMAPKQGVEKNADLVGDTDAHGWSDEDARTALWWTRNFPDDIAALGFSLHQTFRYNQHDERYGPRWRHKTQQDRGDSASTLFHTRSSDIWAQIDDPMLRVKMISLEARERNRLREQDQRRRTGRWPFDPSSAPDQDASPASLDDTEVEHRLLDRYR